METLLLPARVVSDTWHNTSVHAGDVSCTKNTKTGKWERRLNRNAFEGVLMRRLWFDLRIDADKHPSLWRLPLWVTGCQNASEMDRQGWAYDDVLTLCKAVVVQKKWECRHSIRQMERKVFRIVYVLPEVKPAEIVQLSLGLGVAA